MPLELRAQRQPWRDGIELQASIKDDRGWHIGQPLVMRRIEEGEYHDEPTLVLRNQEAQLLMDELWRCGLRPSEGTGSAGSLAATQAHLKDMQHIAMGLLRLEGDVS